MPHSSSAWFFPETVTKLDPDWAYACFLLNCVLPGVGTMVSAGVGKGKCRCDTVLVGLGQLLTIPLLLFGWIWSINHGGALMDKAGVKDKSSIESSMTQGQLIKYAMARLMYEMIGTYIITLMFITAPGNSFPLFLTFWIVTAFAIRVSGAHFNAAISFAFSLRKDTGSLSRKMAIWYMAFQCLGALAAGFTCLWILGGVGIAAPGPTSGIDSNGVPYIHAHGMWFRAMYQEMAGTFCLVFFFISQTESKTVISQIETIHCFVLSASYMAARCIVCGASPGVSTYGAMLNPAFAIGIQISSWFGVAGDIGEALKWIWLYPVLPLGGAILAIIFFEFVYRKTQTII